MIEKIVEFKRNRALKKRGGGRRKEKSALIWGSGALLKFWECILGSGSDQVRSLPREMDSLERILNRGHR